MDNLFGLTELERKTDAEQGSVARTASDAGDNKTPSENRVERVDSK